MNEFLSQPPLVQAFLLHLLGFALTLFLTLLLRLAHGASPDQLLRDRCFEVPPLRAVLYVVWLEFWVGLLGGAALALKFAYQMTQTGVDATKIQKLLAALAGVAVFAFLQHWFARRWLDVRGLRPPEISTELATLNRGIPRDELINLGAERFPNVIHPQWRADLWIRRCALLALCAALLGVGFITYDLYQRPRVTSIDWTANITALAALMRWLPPGIGLFVTSAAGVWLLCLLRSNTDYGFLPFRRAWFAIFVLGGLTLGGATAVGATPEFLLGSFALFMLLLSIRLWRDLKTARRYRQVKGVHDAILNDLRPALDYLPALPRDAAFRLPPLDPAELSQRITRGAKNVEEKGPFVTRHIGRFMRLAQVFQEHFVSAILRFLTVRRYVTLAGGIATYESLRWPSVPLWNLDLFPLRPPAGYRNWLDPLLLDAAWDVVKLCHQCGGAGWVWETESYTDTEYYTDSNGRSATRTVTRTRQVRKTCPTCGGAGRLKHSQVLNTQWQRLIVADVSPHIPMPELTEDAEEVCYYRRPLTEHFDSLPPQADCAADPAHPLAAKIGQSADRTAALHTRHADWVEELHEAKLYRSDFRVCGFHTIQIVFRRLRGRAGWFFGRRPEFHFPVLPLSWSMVGTAAFLPPLLLALAGWTLSWAVRLFERF